ncbi:zinc-binding alcohol dehydrogenase family protein [Jatrophihabitans sp. DSM 45814]
MSDLMRAVAFTKSLPIEDSDSLVDIETEVPIPGPQDLLVRVEAVSVNPVDTKVRQGGDPQGGPRILGFDAAGTVIGKGDEVTLYDIGEDVMYAGTINRPGTNAQFHLVDQRLVGPKPSTLSFAEAAALPLTTITVWELLFDRLKVGPGSAGSLLVVSAAGGVGSMVCQLARTMTDLTIVGTASRAETIAWATQMGAHHVVNHHGDLAANVSAVAAEGVDYIFTPQSEHNLAAYAEIIRPFGHIAAIDEPAGLDLRPLKSKSVAWHWQFMFTRPLFQTPDMIEQHRLLAATASMIDSGALRTTMTEEFGPINAMTVRDAHRRVESGAAIGKVVVAGWE